jgi:carboxypeptidase T
MKQRISLFLLALFISFPVLQVKSNTSDRFWMKLKAKNKFERSLIADTGVAIEFVAEDYVIALGHSSTLSKLKAYNLVESSTAISAFDKSFPRKDEAFHDYAELTVALQKLQAKFPEMVSLTSIGKTAEGRDIWAMRISANLAQANQLPAVIYMGGHHAREHLSVEVPLRIFQKIMSLYEQNDPQVRRLLSARDIHYIAAVNPDGLEYDISGTFYKSWRKNRNLNSDGTYGVDLNRNYGFMWGTGGSSTDTSSEVYMGPQSFSEPETRAVRDYVQAHQNISTLLSFHTYSQLILYPWGHKFEGISNSQDKAVHETMANKMATWNNYIPQQSSELYIASGDTTDWSYGIEGIISFTFELDPGRWGGGGFYPGDEIIGSVVEKNLKPVLYLMEYADNPYRVLSER